MKRFAYRSASKTAAVLLLCVCALVFLGSLLCLVELQERQAFSNGYDSARQNLLSDMGRSKLQQIGSQYFYSGYLGSDIFPHTNLRFSIELEDGSLLYSNYQDEDVLWSGTQAFSIPRGWQKSTAGTYPQTTDYEVAVAVTPVVTPNPVPVSPVVTPDPVPDTPEPTSPPAEGVASLPVVTPAPQPSARIDDIDIDVDEDTTLSLSFQSSSETADAAPESEVPAYALIRAYVLSALPEQDEFSFRLSLFAFLYQFRYFAMAAVFLSVFLGIALYCFLLRSAGVRDADGNVTPGWLEKIPYDLFTLCCICLFFVPVIVISDFGTAYNILGFMILAGMMLLAGLVFLVFSMSTAVRIKTRTLWSSCLLVRICRRLISGLRKAGRGLLRLLQKLPLLRRDLILVLGVFLLEYLILAMTSSFDAQIAVVLVLKDLALLAGITWLLLGFGRIREGTKALAAGSLSSSVPTSGLLLELKEHAEDLNRIRDGMNTAVEERLKSERFRTELITNVSHDIKTPLTSIINYVDLLQKEQPSSETEREYLEVLGRQSVKLKKLIEDLIEASKASTGSLQVNPEACDLIVLMQQMAGEYEERFYAAALTTVLSASADSAVIHADGRHMWRICDNLLSNICKYAQPGTRVYLKTEITDGAAVVTFRNISREELDISPEELTARFTRGDSSRSTEGNGLGLSIAESLTRLQGGDMTLTVDGDLFKVVLRFPLMEADSSPQAG
ncbi:MAG: HAMP domain-containing histidine kinase [Oscillospiraceae bacterium]|nr:HAMP domain-containing histidine kinase [Oscillospiraceae bacterium]